MSLYYISFNNRVLNFYDCLRFPDFFFFGIAVTFV